MTDLHEWHNWKAQMQRYRRGERSDEPMCPFQYGRHIDTLPVEDNSKIKTNRPIGELTKGVCTRHGQE